MTKHAIEEQTFVIRCACGKRLRIQVTHIAKAEAEQSAPEVARDETLSSQQFQSPAAVADNKSPQQEPTNPSPAFPIAPSLRTYELFAMNDGRAVPLASAFRRPALQGGLRPGFELVVGDAPDDGFGLAGIPGRWRDFYDARCPTEFGHDADKAVMYWEPKDAAGRGVALSAEALSQLYGRDWRQTVYGADGE